MTCKISVTKMHSLEICFLKAGLQNYLAQCGGDRQSKMGFLEKIT